MEVGGLGRGNLNQLREVQGQRGNVDGKKIRMTGEILGAIRGGRGMREEIERIQRDCE